MDQVTFGNDEIELQTESVPQVSRSSLSSSARLITLQFPWTSTMATPAQQPGARGAKEEPRNPTKASCRAWLSAARSRIAGGRRSQTDSWWIPPRPPPCRWCSQLVGYLGLDADGLHLLLLPLLHHRLHHYLHHLLPLLPPSRALLSVPAGDEDTQRHTERVKRGTDHLSGSEGCKTEIVY